MRTNNLNRRLNRRLIVIIGIVLIVLVVLVLVIGRGNLPLFGTAGAPPVVDAAYAALNVQLGRTVSPNNSTYAWSLGPYPDASLGCPQPGLTYQQTQVDGYQVTINYQGVAYDYRARSDGSGMFLCSAGGAPTGSSGNASGSAGTAFSLQIKEPTALVDAVFGDINSRFNTQISRANSRYYYYYSSYTDAGLGCAQTGKTYTPATTWGWQILVKPATGGSYDYRGLDEANFWLCSK